ncbi:MAG: homoserine kinase [Pseudonocardiaceae bacterium]|nr:homoserine kinase [Pseudonocardiaceae bacterium]
MHGHRARPQGPRHRLEGRAGARTRSGESRCRRRRPGAPVSGASRPVSGDASQDSYRHSRPVHRVRVRVPASTANLGSGFDTLGMALALHDEVEFAVAGSGLRIQVEGQGSGEVPTDERHLVVRALRGACEHLGYDLPGLELRCRNRIPHSRGLGSSAAAIVSGVLAGYALAGAEPDDAVLGIAAGFEKHADNAAACLFGGLAIAWSGDDGFHATRLEPHPSLAPVLLVPESTSSTEAARGLLPAQVPHADAAFAACRAALAVHALSQEPSLLLTALDDRLHQPYRRAAYPATGELVDALRAAGAPAAVSGAGPTVLALPGNGELPDGVDTSGFTTHRLDIDRTGATLRRL